MSWSQTAMAEWKSIIKEYIIFGENNIWTCRSCQLLSRGHRNRIIAHLFRIPGKGVKICPKISPEKVEKLQRELVKGPHSTDADGQQPQQPAEKDDISHKNGNKKRKVALGGGNDQPMHTLRDGARNSTSPLRNAHGVEMASAIVLVDEPQITCPPGFDPDLWKFYLGIDKENFWSTRISVLYRECMKSIYKEDRMVLLDFLKSACSEVRNYFTNAPPESRSDLWDRLYRGFLSNKFYYLSKRALEHLNNQVVLVEEIEKEIRGETEHGVKMPARKRSSNTKNWVGYAASFKSDMDDLIVEARKAKSLEDTIDLWMHANQLPKLADILIKMGTSLLYPVSTNVSSWNQMKSMYILFPADDSW